jgi:hypothetical protein
VSTGATVVCRGRRAKLTASLVGIKADEGVAVVVVEVAVGACSPVPVISDMMATTWSCRSKVDLSVGGV